MTKRLADLVFADLRESVQKQLRQAAEIHTVAAKIWGPQHADVLLLATVNLLLAERVEALRVILDERMTGSFAPD